MEEFEFVHFQVSTQKEENIFSHPSYKLNNATIVYWTDNN